MTGSTAIKKISSFATVSASLLKSIAVPTWNVLSHDFSNVILPEKCLSISIEQSGFSIAYVKKIFSRFKVAAIKKYPIETANSDPEFLASSAAFFANEFGADKTAVTLSIPKSWVITKIVEFPSSIKEDIPSVISYEMDRITPFDSSDALYDFKIIEEINGKIKILLAATRNQVLKPYLDALSNKGIIVQKVTINSSAVDSIIRHAVRQTSNLYLEISDRGYEGALFTYSYPIAFFGSEFKDTEDKHRLTQIVDDIRHFIEQNKKNGISPEIYILFKNKSLNIKENLRLMLNMPFRTLNEIDLKISFAMTKDEISYSAVGAAIETLWQKSNGFNLFSKGQVVIPRKPLVLTIILLIVLSSIGILYAVAPLYIENQRIEEIDRQIAARKEEVRKVEALKKEIEVLNKDIALIKDFKNGRQMSLNFIKEFTSIAPKNTWLTRMRITEKTVEIEGYASSATELMPKLETSKLFQKVEFASPTFRDARMNSDRFNIRMEIEGLEKKQDLGNKNEKE